jgi:ATP/maltotriose-dependent transcriptional regulator MalT
MAAWRGRQADVARLTDSAGGVMEARGEGRWLAAAAWASAVVHNGLGEYDVALAAAEEGSEYPDDLGLAHHCAVELIEAAARIGRPDRASDALDRLSRATTASGGDWALGIRARARALLSDGDTAERCYRESVERLGRTRVRAELARTHLLYGEWLRRERRRTDAREQLRTACEMLNAMGLDAFAERARRELLATGETATLKQATLKQATLTWSAETSSALTPQEAQVARLALHGLSNPEIGTRLFISARTVQYHLSKVFAKLGISSRGQLHRVLSCEPH